MRLTFFEASFQAVTDGEASLRQEVIKQPGGKGLAQRLQAGQAGLGTSGAKGKERGGVTESNPHGRTCGGYQAPFIHQVVDALLQLVFGFLLSRLLVQLLPSCLENRPVNAPRSRGGVSKPTGAVLSNLCPPRPRRCSRWRCCSG